MWREVTDDLCASMDKGLVDVPTRPLRQRRRWSPAWWFVALPVLFNLWSLRAERLIVAYPNDAAMHLQMSTLAGRLLQHGIFPLDHWYGFLSQGSPFFVEYQSFSAIIVGALGQLFSTASVFAWSLYLLLALWPLCVYVSGRIFGWARREAAAAALLAPLLHSITGRGFEHESYVWVGSGLWSQEWAMWTLPLALAFSWRFVSRRDYLFPAVFFLTLTIAFHFLTAYLAGLSLVLWVIVRPREWRQRTPRALAVGALSLVASAWVTVPLWWHAADLAANEFQVHTVINNSYGLGRVATWFVRGDLFDSGRLALITTLVVIGLFMSVMRWRRDERARAITLVWLLSLFLFIGRPTFSLLINLLPGNQSLLLQRYISGLDLAGLYLAGSALVGVGSLFVAMLHSAWPTEVAALRHARGMRRLRVPLVAIVLIMVLSPGWLQIARYDHRSAVWLRWEQGITRRYDPDINALIAITQRDGGGRIYAGMPSNWGRQFYMGQQPIYMYLEQHLIDTVGFTLRGSGLMTNPEAYFDQYNAGDYAVFGIHYLLWPAGRRPPVPATRVAVRGPFALYTVPSRGLVHVVTTQGVIVANADNLGATTRYWLEGSEPSASIYPTIAYDGHAGAPDTASPGAAVTGVPGRVLHETDNVILGETIKATVEMTRPGVVVASASFDRGWTVTIDGQRAATEMVAPALVAVQVPAGRHVVVFTYEGYPDYPILLTLSGVTLLATAAWSWRRRATRAVR